MNEDLQNLEKRVNTFKTLRLVFWILFGVFSLGVIVVACVIVFNAYDLMMALVMGSVEPEYALELLMSSPLIMALLYVLVVMSLLESGSLVCAIIFTVLKATNGNKLIKLRSQQDQQQVNWTNDDPMNRL